MRIPHLLLIAALLLPLHARAQKPTAISYDEWRTRVLGTERNIDLLQNRKFPDKAKLPLPQFGDFGREIDRLFAQQRKSAMADEKSWIGEKPKEKFFFRTDIGYFSSISMPFQPFAMKKSLPPGSKVLIHGDLHGDVHTLIAELDKLNADGVLKGFKIVDPKMHMAFLGDFTDRGLYGVEVLYTLTQLKLQNPDRVVLGRGNHEDVALIKEYGFVAEGRHKYGDKFDVAKVARVYDFLPVVLYLGCGENFLQCNHGGMEPGFFAGDLISSGATPAFKFLGDLKQATFVKEHPEFKKAYERAMKAEPEARALADFRPKAPMRPSTIGFMWNDFSLFKEEPFAYQPGRGWDYDKKMTALLLKANSTDKAKLRGVFRAHQHSSRLNPMMRRLIATRGVFRHWQDADSAKILEANPIKLQSTLESGAKRPLTDGAVYTFNLSPDSIYGLRCGFAFGTYGILTVAEKFEDWELEIHNVNVRQIR